MINDSLLYDEILFRSGEYYFNKAYDDAESVISMYYFMARMQDDEQKIIILEAIKKEIAQSRMALAKKYFED